MPADESVDVQASELSGAGTAERESFDMKETSGERERYEPGSALSRPHRLKSVPAVLSLLGIGCEGALNRKSPARRPGLSDD
jgi:hypothetical protein